MLAGVSDTAFWVASYRGDESRRADALFHDPLAARLAGEKGRSIAAAMSGSHYTGWAVVVRTVVIDRLITGLIAQGVDTVLNLGAGLDTRPYRLALPPSLQWIETDHAATVQFKDQMLAGERPRCRLGRRALDLSDGAERRRLFAEVAAQAGKVAVLTEGVIPYLAEEEVHGLAEDLRRQPRFRYWILDYNSHELVKRMRRGRRGRQMRNAPFRFDPADWFAFFDGAGWRLQTACYLPEEGRRLGRVFPLPRWVRLLQPLMGAKAREQFDRMLGYMLMVPKDAGR